MSRTVKFVIGAAASGKTTFIKNHFSEDKNTIILNVYDYQQAIYSRELIKKWKNLDAFLLWKK